LTRKHIRDKSESCENDNISNIYIYMYRNML
jgi:hypothetical protein